MKRKGFTLIELLGVIVVLAVIAIITTPVILGVIEKSKKGALQNSGYGLVEAGILYHAEYQNSQTVRFDIKNNQIRTKEENKIDYKGSIKDGTVLVNNQGEVTVCINDGKYAAYKNYKDNKIIVVDQKTCTVPENNYIVYLDNESTAENNNQELIARLEKLETTIKEQAKEIDSLKSEKANTNEITNSINNLMTTHNSDIININTKILSLTNRLNKLTYYPDYSKMNIVVGSVNTKYTPTEPGYIIFKYSVYDGEHSSNMGMTGYIDGTAVYRYSFYHQAGAMNDGISAPYPVLAGQTIYFDVVSGGATQYGSINFVPLKYYQ